MSGKVCQFSHTHPPEILFRNYVGSIACFGSGVALICAIASKLLHSSPKADAFLGISFVALLQTMNVIDHQISNEKDTHTEFRFALKSALTLLVSYSIRHFAHYQTSAFTPLLSLGSMIVIDKFTFYLSQKNPPN